jgi:hypothetical protein
MVLGVCVCGGGSCSADFGQPVLSRWPDWRREGAGRARVDAAWQHRATPMLPLFAPAAGAAAGVGADSADDQDAMETDDAVRISSWPMRPMQDLWVTTGWDGAQGTGYAGVRATQAPLFSLTQALGEDGPRSLSLSLLDRSLAGGGSSLLVSGGVGGGPGGSNGGGDDGASLGGAGGVGSSVHPSRYARMLRRFTKSTAEAQVCAVRRRRRRRRRRSMGRQTHLSVC